MSLLLSLESLLTPEATGGLLMALWFHPMNRLLLQLLQSIRVRY